MRALAGAAPPLIGFAAASGGFKFGAWILYAMLFLWQFPHFVAIAWMQHEAKIGEIHEKAAMLRIK